LARILLFNKPYGVLTQFRPSEQGPTLADYIRVPAVYPAGRLDKDSEGLLVLTDAGWIQHRIAHPASKLAKIYWVQVEGLPDPAVWARLAQGVELADGLTRPATVRPIPEPPGLWPRDPPVRFRKTVPTAWLEITLREGRNRQVRRMTAAVGHPTLRLIRYRIGPWTLDGLASGEWHGVPVPQALRLRRPRPS
jgi:23S rRNA pseudouridine2457 synthase